ncbi:MAG: helix-hairpin-helix domain-containing protein [Prevotella sp.]|nr:helix-hairpin-helix domain-containing protein [Prevotella sp.]
MSLRSFFYINKSDRRIILALLLLGLVAFATVGLLQDEEPTAASTSSAVKWRGGAGQRQKASSYYQVEERHIEHFPFDPNTADSTQLLRLGLYPWQVRNIYHYRASGGVYRSKADFGRLYGLTVKQYRELEPFIRISSDYLPAATAVPDEVATRRDTTRYTAKLREGETISLNLLDTAALQRVPGIGSYYARRIVAYGQRLGGYASVEQLNEIDDLPAGVSKYLRITGQDHIRQLAVNRLSLNELRRHPYINYYQARAIIDYRRQHGTITDLQQLSLLPDFPPEAIARLRPYISYQ